MSLFWNFMFNRFMQVHFGFLVPRTNILNAIITFFLVSWSCALQFSDAGTSTISIGRPLTVASNITSAGNRFEMGFYSFSNAKNKYYVGIWYKKVSLQTVVWTANRDFPLTSSSVSLTICEDGNLVILDGKVRYKVSNIPTTSNTSCTLLDSGNLVLRDENSNVLWQSFDFPTDTLLPGMKLGFDRISGKNWSLVSGKSPNDPSPGDYSWVADPDGKPQVFIMKGSKICWSSGTWNGQIFSFVPEMTQNYIYNYSVESNENFTYITYSAHNNNISRYWLDASGSLMLSLWSEKDKQWWLSWSKPRNSCEMYGFCGAFGTCDSEVTVASCLCLPGFNPQNPENWALGNYSEGCARKVGLQCSNSTAVGTVSSDRFVITHNYFAANPQTKEAETIKDCESCCLENCLCTAFTCTNNSCSTWEGDIVNLRKNNEFLPTQNLYIRLAGSELASGTETRGAKSKIKLWTITISVVSLTILTLSAFICWFRKRKLREEGEDLLSFDFKVNEIVGKLNRDAMATELARKEVDISLFSLSSVSAATNNFSSANKLGEGGFGPVYKGKLLNGYKVAVKRLSRWSGQGWEELQNEAMLIGKLQHKNLVKLLGCCIQGEEKILIYEYHPNKSLDLFLFGPSRAGILHWSDRVRIIEGIAQGLLYLHQFSRVQIIHRDLKSSNILLDKDMNPKISDFGLARICGECETQETKRVVGTLGYMPPEYVMNGIFSVKSDVFSFGVLLLEILSGKKSNGFRNCNSLSLLGYAWDLWKKDEWMEFMDPVLVNISREIGVSRFINIALLCVQESANDRPTMSNVVSMLSNEAAILPFPKQPAFANAPATFTPNQNQTHQPACSLNYFTVSIISPR